MQTVIIYNDTAAPIQFTVLDGDHSHLDEVYINQSGDDALVAELSDLIYDPETGKVLVTFVEKFPVEAVLAGAKVIVCGFLA